MSLALAATTPTTTSATASLHSSLASRTSPAPPTPTIPIPPQCQQCHGPNSTFPAMVCYKNTQCVPQTYLCDTISNPCTDSDGEPDSDDPILCNNDQLCVPQNYLPYPSPGFGKVQQTDSCLSGSYYSLYGSTKKYTKSCIEPFVDRPPDCEPWEYAAQSSCYLSTCGEPDLNCEPPFVCQKAHSNDPYGLCSNPNDPSGNSGGAAGTSDGGSTTDRYSSRDYLIQGLLIGACSLAIGVGLGVGFWHYRQKKRSRTQWAPSSSSSSSPPPPATASSLAPGAAAATAAAAAGDSSTSKHPSWLSTVLLCGRNKTRQRSATVSMDSNHNVPSSGQHRDSLVDSESLEGSLFGDQRRRERSNNMLFSGRWRWGERTTSAHHHALSRNLVMMMSMGPPDPEMDPPPVYHIGPKLPAYTDRTEDIPRTSVHATTARSAQTTDPPESTRPTSHPSSTRSAYDRHSSGSFTDLTTRAHLQLQGNPPDIVRAQQPRQHTGTSTNTDTDTDMDMDTSSSSSSTRHSSNTYGSNIPMPERAHLRKQD
ncbi:hypothetical protein BGZ75_001187 [Mortierella antarctica]|nr:hypothetical protein BGZ75_001187 [Mortierella antarctica]